MVHDKGYVVSGSNDLLPARHARRSEDGRVPIRRALTIEEALLVCDLKGLDPCRRIPAVASTLVVNEF